MSLDVREAVTGPFRSVGSKKQIVHFVAVRLWNAMRTTRLLTALVVVWALLSAISALRDAATRAANPVTALESEFNVLAGALPPSGSVGFLRYDVDDDSAEHVMVYYVAQYSLAPRLIEKRTDREFLVVARDAMRPGVDDRLTGFEPVASSKAGYRIYRRRVE